MNNSSRICFFGSSSQNLHPKRTSYQKGTPDFVSGTVQLLLLNLIQISRHPTIWSSDIVSLFVFICCLQCLFTYVAEGLWVPPCLAVLRGAADRVGKGTHGDCRAVLCVSADARELYPGLGALRDSK